MDMGIRAGSLRDILGRIASEAENSQEAPRPLDDAIIAELRIRGAVHVGALDRIPFNIGDFVTARPGTVLNNPGVPGMVIDVAPGAKPHFYPEVSADGYAGQGNRNQIRVLTWQNGKYLAFWHEAGNLIAWDDREVAAD